METLRRLLDLLGDELELSAEPIDYGHDRAMLQANLARTPSERVDRGVALADFVRRNRALPVTEPFEPKAILRALADHGVEHIVVGGLAGMAHGSSFPSYHVDTVYSRSGENLARLAETLQELGATLRGADAPFLLDARTLRAGLNFTFETRYGSLDILGEPAYDTLLQHAIELEIDGVPVLVASLDDLIRMKEAAGRTKDLLMATEYRVLADEISRREG